MTAMLPVSWVMLKGAWAEGATGRARTWERGSRRSAPRLVGARVAITETKRAARGSGDARRSIPAFGAIMRVASPRSAPDRCGRNCSLLSTVRDANERKTVASGGERNNQCRPGDALAQHAG